MKKKLILLAAICGLMLSGCAAGSTDLAPEDETAMEADFQACLGDLTVDAGLSDEEIDALREQFIPVWNLRQDRLEKGDPYMSKRESKLFGEFSAALDEICYDTYEEEGWDYDSEADEYDLVDYPVNEDGTLGEGDYYDDWDDFDYTDEDLTALWEKVEAILPDGAAEVFDYYSVFTDGTDYTVAYTGWDDSDPDNVIWYFALDPEDVYDEDYFNETLVHEYCHYMTLNGDQAIFGTDGSLDTYCEEDYYELKEDSYLNQFYQQFWNPILKDEALVSSDNVMFFYRHYEDFCDDYATYDPAEDIAESFSYYIYGDEENWTGDTPEVWQQKIAWFDQFDEFRDFREAVLAKSEIDPGMEQQTA